MSVQLRDLLQDVLSIVDPFRDDISHVLMKRTNEGDIAIAAKSREGNISVSAIATSDVPEFHGVACLGSLPYLSAVINSKYVQDDKFSMDIEYHTASDGKTNALHTISFKGGKKKLEAFYQATDPFVNKLNRIKMPAIKDWEASFVIDQNFIKDFSEVVKVHRAAPKIGGDRDDIFTFAISGNEAIAVFGEKGHQTNMTLSESAKVTGVDKLSALLPLTHFQAILKLIGKGTGKARFTTRAMRVDMNTDKATYSLTILAKKQSI